MAPGRGATAPYPLLLALGALDATGYSVIVPVAPAISDATGAGPRSIPQILWDTYGTVRTRFERFLAVSGGSERHPLGR